MDAVARGRVEASRQEESSMIDFIEIALDRVADFTFRLFFILLVAVLVLAFWGSLACLGYLSLRAIL